MRHELETVCAAHVPHAFSDMAKMRALLQPVIEAHDAPGRVLVDGDRTHVRVVVWGNGAILRDVVETLDRNGWLG